MLKEIKVDISDVTIKLPSTHLTVSKDEYHDLKKQSSQGQYMTLNEVLDLLSVSRP